MNTTSEQIYKYVKYLTAHIARVREAMRRFINDTDGLDYIGSIMSVGEKAQTVAELTSRADSHDKSKWQVDEFFPYLEHFYPIVGDVPEEGEDPDFDRACQLHYERNDHHDRYWRIEGRDINDMSITAICEMLADWVSMSVYSQRSPLIWYNENKEEVLEGMTEQNIQIVETLLNRYFEPIYQTMMEEVNRKI